MFCVFTTTQIFQKQDNMPHHHDCTEIWNNFSTGKSKFKKNIRKQNLTKKFLFQKEEKGQKIGSNGVWEGQTQQQKLFYVQPWSIVTVG